MRVEEAFEAIFSAQDAGYILDLSSSNSMGIYSSHVSRFRLALTSQRRTQCATAVALPAQGFENRTSAGDLPYSKLFFDKEWKRPSVLSRSQGTAPCIALHDNHK